LKENCERRLKMNSEYLQQLRLMVERIDRKVSRYEAEIFDLQQKRESLMAEIIALESEEN
jgi:hypothetical protein